MAKIFDAIIVVVLINYVKSTDVAVCLNNNPCLCQLDENNKIDLAPVFQNFTDEDFVEDGDTHGNYFYFRGCKDGLFNATKKGIVFNGSANITLDASLIHAFVNQTNRTNSFVKAVAKVKDAKFFRNDHNVYEIVYKSGENVLATVQLVCVNDDDTAFKQIHPDNPSLSFALYSPYSCVIKHQQGLSTGSVLLIMFFICLGVYFIGGALLLYCIRGARGLELIPNIDFWRGLPGLIKDGVIFLFSGCNSSAITTPETYDRI